MPSDRTLLAFDTSAAHCAATLLSGDTIIAHASEDMTHGQAERLLPLLNQLLAESGLDWHDLDGLAVGVGPGNFTGIRIAVSAARGLALGLGIPAIGVPILEARAEGLSRPLIVADDARRGAVYLQTFVPEPEAARMLALSDLSGTDPLPVTGTAARAVASVTGGPVLESHTPLAEAIARVGARKARSGQPRPAPLYIRPADAAAPSEPAPVILP